MKIAIMNQKGGATKTETSKTLAVELAKEQTITLVDADPQANDTIFFNCYDGKSILDVVVGDESVKDITTNINNNLNLVRSANNLSALDVSISTQFGGETKLLRTLEEITSNTEMTIFDCPPAFNRLTAAIIATVDYIIIPIIPSVDAIDGYTTLLQNIVDIMEVVGNNSKKIKILIARYNEHRIADRENLEKILGLKHPIFETYIRESTAVNRARNANKTIIEFDANNNVAKDYLTFIAEFKEDIRRDE